jgi:hypothetical protein
MKKIALLISLIFVMALAIPAPASGSNHNRKNNASFQITGVLEGSLEFVLLPGADPTDIYAVDEIGYASGVVKGLGFVHMFDFHRPDPDSEEGGLMDGHVTIVTSGNDIIKAIYSGGTTVFASEDQLVGNVDFEIIGGTGRFENASGTIHSTAYATFIGFDVWEWPVTWVLEGEIEY